MSRSTQYLHVVVFGPREDGKYYLAKTYRGNMGLGPFLPKDTIFQMEGNIDRIGSQKEEDFVAEAYSEAEKRGIPTKDFIK